MTDKLLLFAAFVLVMLLMSYNYTKKKKKIIFFGDSITEQGTRPGGYISKINTYINTELLDHKYEVVGSGKGGNKVHDLCQRLEKDVLAQGADIVVIFIGVNDAWDNSLNAATPDITKFESHYEAILQKLSTVNIKAVLCTPAVIGERVGNTNPMDDAMNIYSDVIRQLAVKHDLKLVDLRKAFTAYNATNNPENQQYGILTEDGIHLNYKGDELVAEEMWKVIKEIK